MVDWTALLSALFGASIAGFFAVGLALLGQRNARSLLGDERKNRADEAAVERREWYRRTVYDRRLTATQEASTWLSKINVLLNRAKPGDTTDAATLELLALCRDTRAWYDANRIMLEDGLPTSSSFVGLLNQLHEYAVRGQTPGIPSPWTAFLEVDKALRTRVDDLLGLLTDGGPRA